MARGDKRERAGWRDRWARRIPGVAWLAARFGRVASWRVGRYRVGLLALLPVAILIDVFDAADELFGGPIGMAVAFVVESAFLLAVTGRASWALGGGAIDLVPGVDLLPIATISVLVEFVRDAAEAPREDGRHEATGPVIDV